jgi:hypothetical protein
MLSHGWSPTFQDNMLPPSSIKPETAVSFATLNTLGTGYLNCLYAYKRKFASPVLNVLITPTLLCSVNT